MRQIYADLHSVKGKLNRYFSRCIGAGRAGEVMRHAAMKQLHTLQHDCPFDYIRFHGLFHEEIDIVRRDTSGKLTFCFQYVDLLFDELLEAGIRPIVELGLMPEVLASEQQYVFWWKMNKSMPKDIGEWSQLIEELLRHLTRRYGEEEIKQWYFEVWNEPNHPGFFTEYKNINAYFDLYDAAAFAVKKVNASYRVGGPATAGLTWLKELIDHCREKDVPLDFITSHDYSVEGAFDADGTAATRLKSIDHIPRRMKYASKICREANLPLIITEWSSSYSARDPIHDSYFNAPFLLYVIRRCDGLADMFSYWTYTDIFEETSPPRTPFHGGFGLMNVQSIPKPSYYVYQFLHWLGDTELTCADTDAYVCKSADEVQILFWNITQPDIPTCNREYFVQPLPSKEIEDAQIVFDGFAPGQKCSVSIRTIGYRSGDVYNAYLEGNFTDLPTRDETKQLIEQSRPKETTLYAEADEHGTLRLFVAQQENQVDMIRIRPV